MATKAEETRARLEELRAVGDRLMLGDPDARKVRGLVCDFIDVLLGRNPNHEDVNVSGARPPALAPELIRQVIPGHHGGPPQSRPQLAAATITPPGTPSDAETIAEIERMAQSAAVAPATPTGEPRPALSIEEAIAIANERRRKQHENAAAKPPNGGQ